MTIHIGAEPGDIAPTVLMPGDPKRATWAAERFLDDARQVNAVRGMAGYTGTWRGHPVTIHGSGMGMASLSIYANELIRDFGARTLIRIGSCGAMQPDVALRDVILAMTASSISTPSSTILRELNFAPCADWGLLRAAMHAAEAMGSTPHVGGIYSSDTFYDERSDLTDALTRHGTLAVEMEAAELYTVAARYGARALAVLTVSDHLITGAALDAQARQSSFGEMVEIALAAAFGVDAAA
ncbi:purine-nucleoside phosphorylase [Roseovarius sp. ZX-A-9]|uniref:purine-nucleoside phosphorylase n=1 Tax=Roseovarius sp. ZX-A-9 TaxID=3014783 RepID=UPI00232F71C5|nr:purine-nucleoside phosphorylase [Roseovarius sp. ZX-A-9]